MLPTRPEQHLPESQQWFMELMFAFGYFKCALVNKVSFDPEDFETFHFHADFVFVISNEKLYFVDQVNHECHTIESDNETIGSLAKQLQLTMPIVPIDAVLIEDLSSKQLEIIESQTLVETSIKGGMCYGVATMAIPVNLLDDKEEILRFNRRFELVSFAFPNRGMEVDLASIEAKQSIAAFLRRFEQAKNNVINEQRKLKEEKKDDDKFYSIHDDKIYLKISRSQSLEALESELESKEEKLALDKAILAILSVFDGIAVSQDPKKFNVLFEEKVQHQNANAVLSLITPVLLDDKKGELQPVKLNKNVSLICKRDELIQFFQVLAKHFNGIPFSMVFSSERHAINISFHPTWESPWVLTEPSDLPSKLIKTEADLVKYLASRLSSKNEVIAFSGELFVCNKNRDNANNLLDQLMITPGFLQLREVTKDRSQLLTLSLNTWIHCAARSEDELLVQELLKQNADPAKANRSGITAYDIAFRRSEKISALMWKKIVANVSDMKLDEKTAEGRVINDINSDIGDIQRLEALAKETDKQLRIVTEQISRTNNIVMLCREAIDEITSLLKTNPKYTDEFSEKLKTYTEEEKHASLMHDQHIKELKKLEELHAKILKLKNKHKNLKRTITKKISIFNELVQLIQLIKDKIEQNRIDPSVLKNLFDPVFAVFPSRMLMARQLSLIVDRYDISEKFHEKEYNKLDLIFIKIHRYSVNRGLKLISLLLIFTRKYIANKIHFYFSDLAKSLLFLDDLSQSIDARLNEKEFFDKIMQHYESAKNNPKDSDYLDMLVALFSTLDINLNEASRDKIFEQFQAAIENIEVSNISKKSLEQGKSEIEEKEYKSSEKQQEAQPETKSLTAKSSDKFEPCQLEVDNTTYLHTFTSQLLEDLHALSPYRKNCIGALFKVSAVNKEAKEKLERCLKECQERLKVFNVKIVAAQIAYHIKAYQQILVLNEGGKFGQSRYLASLNAFLQNKNLLPIQTLRGSKILENKIVERDMKIDFSSKVNKF